MLELDYGWSGRVLRVDLSTHTIKTQPLEGRLALSYIGGRGLNLRRIYDELKPGTDPLSPANLLILGVGPCNGTLIPTSNRFTVTSRAPIHGFIGDSNCGGSFGPELKYAGYDQLIISGKADNPTYLWIEDDLVELKDASHIWGKNSWETQDMIKKELGDSDIPVIAIGPAGENMVKFASIIHGMGRAAGRTGIGAVMGSKNLKAIAVNGTKNVEVADIDLVEEIMCKTIEDLKRENIFAPHGTPQWFKIYSEIGSVAGWNYQSGTLKERAETLDTDLLPTLFYWGRKACYSCPVACDHLYVIDKGYYAGVCGDGAELTMWQKFGATIGNFDLAFLLKLNTVTDQYGLDAGDLGGVLGYTMESYERGILTQKDLGGLALKWGEQEPTLKLVEMIAYRRGFGDILAEGVGKAAQIVGRGSEKYAMHVKNTHFCTADGRAIQSWGLGYAVASRGACHMRAATADNLLKPDCYTTEGRGKLVAYYEHLRAIEDSLEICKFLYWNLSRDVCRRFGKGIPISEAGHIYVENLAKMYNAVTGVGIGTDEILRIGERIINLERVFNVREGLTRKDDTLPERWLKEPMPEGDAKGHVNKLDVMLNDYYENRGWNLETGFPTKGKLTELDLGDAIEALEAVYARSRLAPNNRLNTSL